MALIFVSKYCNCGKYLKEGGRNYERLIEKIKLISFLLSTKKM